MCTAITPHGANTDLSAPLWNRTYLETTYEIYDSATQPGVNSLTCLSCHDGQIATDSIVNMPGSGRYSAAQQRSQNDSFLNSWPGGPGSSFWGGHGTLEVSAAAFNRYGECQSCHSVDGDMHDPNNIPAFDVAYLSKDLTNDHPIGVNYPGGGFDFKDASATKNNMRFFDNNGDGRADSDELRFYETGDGYEVECASCHDPHGVPLSGSGTGGAFTPAFLRTSNDGSQLCLTCHIK